MKRRMKKVLLSLLMVVSLLSALPASAVYVKGYYRKDGTYVSAHYRKPPRRKGPSRSGSRRRKHAAFVLNLSTRSKISSVTF